MTRVIPHNYPVKPRATMTHAGRILDQRPAYTLGEILVTANWLNGKDQPLVITQSEADDPLLGQHRKA